MGLHATQRGCRQLVPVAESLLSAIKRQAEFTDSVIVSYSGGKESVIILDLCTKFFKEVHAFRMTYVDGLSFEDVQDARVKSQYGIDVYRVPHFELSRLLKYGVYCKPNPELPLIKINDIYKHVRNVFGVKWIAAGERAADSVVRRARMMQHGSIYEARGRFFPLAYWKKAHVMKYLQETRLLLSPESKVLGASFAGPVERDMPLLKKHFPDDYAKILEVFPEIVAHEAREVIFGKDQVPKRGVSLTVAQ